MENRYRMLGGVVGLTVTLLYLGVTALALVIAFRFVTGFWYYLAEVLVFVFLIPAIALSYQLAKTK